NWHLVLELTFKFPGARYEVAPLAQPDAQPDNLLLLRHRTELLGITEAGIVFRRSPLHKHVFHRQR
ncbi:hypothetical protein, partial [Scytonema sp. PCC 10023]|uniref:hypothetical protein n=1 Tax=Scytonema sp. PCC 10023 TaxID=1680591 RepID=UPI0039C64D99